MVIRRQTRSRFLSSGRVLANRRCSTNLECCNRYRRTVGARHAERSLGQTTSASASRDDVDFVRGFAPCRELVQTRRPQAHGTGRYVGRFLALLWLRWSGPTTGTLTEPRRVSLQRLEVLSQFSLHGKRAPHDRPGGPSVWRALSRERGSCGVGVYVALPDRQASASILSTCKDTPAVGG